MKYTAKFERQLFAESFVTWDWHVVTGCNIGCSYCGVCDYVKKRFGTFRPQFHESELAAPYNSKPDPAARNNRVIVGPLGDLFCSEITDEQINEIIKVASDNPQWLFYFLTKVPERLVRFDFPSNAMTGVTIDRQSKVKTTEEIMGCCTAGFKIAALDPLLEPIEFNHPELFSGFILGPLLTTASLAAFQPKWQWIESVLAQAADVGALIWLKMLMFRPIEYRHVKFRSLCDATDDEIRDRIRRKKIEAAI